MNSSCNRELSYLESAEFLTLTAHIITIFSTPIHLLGFYIIIAKTPLQMKSVKWFLLNLHFGIISFDYSFCILSIPFLLVPEFAGHPLGLLKYLGFSTLSIIILVAVSVTYMVISIVAVFENRFNVLCTFSWIVYWKKVRVPWILSYYLLFTLACIPYVEFVPDQNIALQYIFQKLPCLPSYVYTADNFVLTLDFTYHVTVAVSLVSSASGFCLFFVSTLVLNAVQQLKENTISDQTFQMQKRFFIALIIQIIIPLVMFVIPLGHILYSILVEYYNQVHTNLAVLIVNMHGFVSTIVMIYVHRPYREAVLAAFRTIIKSTEVSVIKNVFVKRYSMAPIAN